MIKYRIKQLKFYLTKYGILGTIKKVIKVLKGRKQKSKEYQEFINRTEPTIEELEKQRNEKFVFNPKISIIVPMEAIRKT